MTELEERDRKSGVDQRGTELCQACGLCCDGTFFTFTSFSDLENEDGQTMEGGKSNSQPQPCAYHQCEGGCSIYASRPSVCRTFRCLLLKGVSKEQMTLDAAIEIVSQAKRHRRELETAMKRKASFLKPLPLNTKFHLIYSRGKAPDGECLREHADAFLLYGTLKRLVQRHFVTGDDKKE